MISKSEAPRGNGAQEKPTDSILRERVTRAFAAAQRETPFDAPTSRSAREYVFWKTLNGAVGRPPFPAKTDELYARLCARSGVRP